ncbi:MAG: PQQ-binding-like beta-propeller repeat protein [Epsilonproteobacteria bacterium]|nr:PQQ-binding-like beta-propeller repeat protein [Campylobacterota bacterium]
MIKYLILLLLSVHFVYATPVLTPTWQLDVNASVKDMVLHEGTLVIGTDNGTLKVYNLKEQKFTKTIALPKVKDFMGDLMPPKVFSVDTIENKYVLLSDSGEGGYVNVWIDEDGKTTQIISAKDKKVIVKVRFIDSTHLLFGYLSNEVALYDLKKSKELYRVQLSESKFSDFALNETKKQVVFACESGVLNVVDVLTGHVVKVLQGQNLDNVHMVDFKKDTVSAAGQDRRAALYDVNTGKGSYISSDFFIYATGLSPSTKKVAFTMNEENTITLYNRNDKSKIAELKGQHSTLNSIIFEDEQTVFASSNNSVVMMWKLS